MCHWFTMLAQNNACSDAELAPVCVLSNQIIRMVHSDSLVLITDPVHKKQVTNKTQTIHTDQLRCNLQVGPWRLTFYSIEFNLTIRIVLNHNKSQKTLHLT